MRTAIIRTPTIGRASALALLLMLAPAGTSTAQEGDAEAARAIKAVLDKQQVDWNRGDLDAFLEGYWHSPGMVFLSGGERNDGFDAMRDRYRKRYQAEGRAMGKLAFSGSEIKPLGGDVALARGRWQLTLPDGKKPGGLYTLVLRKFADGWKIVHDHTSVAEAPAAPEPPSTPTPAPAPSRPVPAPVSPD